MVGLVRTRRPESPADPSRPHEFVEIHDPGMSAMAAGIAGRGNDLGGISAVAIADNYMRKSHCALEGCGRERFDPLHGTPEA